MAYEPAAGSATTDPATPDSATTDPATPDSATTDPATPDSVTTGSVTVDSVTTDELPVLPTDRHTGCPFDPPAALTALSDRPVRPLRYADGHVGRLVTGHAAARAVLADPRFSSRYELLHLPMPMEGAPEELPAAPVGDIIGLDAPEHTRYRRLLAGRFTVRRMRQLTDRIERFTAERLDAMEQAGPTADLMEVFARPVPTLVICELLGVPYADRGRFLGLVEVIFDQAAEAGARDDAYAGLLRYVGELVLAKRIEPTDDLLSDLAAPAPCPASSPASGHTANPASGPAPAPASGPAPGPCDPVAPGVAASGLSDEELAGVGGLLLAAGLDTTANMLGLGVFALLANPVQLDALRADPDLAGPAAEELLRYLSVADPLLRSALEDVEVEGELIRAGETVTVSVQAANRDPRRFPEPDRLDIRRRATGHLSFGHGPHQCLGQQLARVEMAVALPALFARFPALRLAVPPEEVPLRERSSIYGVVSLPVAWGEE